jgi:hypothetical protein
VARYAHSQTSVSPEIHALRRGATDTLPVDECCDSVRMRQSSGTSTFPPYVEKRAEEHVFGAPQAPSVARAEIVTRRVLRGANEQSGMTREIMGGKTDLEYPPNEIQWV